MTMLNDNNQNELIQLADINLAATIRHQMQTTSGSRIQENNGILMFSIGRAIVDAHFNGVLRLDTQIDAAQIVTQAEQFFDFVKGGGTFWIREHADADLEAVLQESGYKAVRVPGSPCMFLDRRLEPTLLPDNIELNRVTDGQDASDYAQVMITAFGMESDIAHTVFGNPKALAAPQVTAFIARRQSVPLAAALTVASGDVAGVYYVGTIPEARGRGLGELCTGAATNAGFDLGARIVILQASAAGEPLYRRMGFQFLTRYRWYRFLPTAT